MVGCERDRTEKVGVHKKAQSWGAHSEVKACELMMIMMILNTYKNVFCNLYFN